MSLRSITHLQEDNIEKLVKVLKKKLATACIIKVDSKNEEKKTYGFQGDHRNEIKKYLLKIGLNETDIEL